jgi:hypothetical protein
VGGKGKKRHQFSERTVSETMVLLKCREITNDIMTKTQRDFQFMKKVVDKNRMSLNEINTTNSQEFMGEQNNDPLYL